MVLLTTLHRMGKLFLGWGNVKWDQDQKHESFTYHCLARARYEATVGENHNRTGDACVKEAQHYFHFGAYDKAL
jgi:hypothetical protein